MNHVTRVSAWYVASVLLFLFCNELSGFGAGGVKVHYTTHIKYIQSRFSSLRTFDDPRSDLELSFAIPIGYSQLKPNFWHEKQLGSWRSHLSFRFRQNAQAVRVLLSGGWAGPRVGQV